MILHIDGMYGSSVLTKININLGLQNMLIIWLFSQSINRLTDFPVAFTSSSFCNLYCKKKKKENALSTENSNLNAEMETSMLPHVHALY